MIEKSLKIKRDQIKKLQIVKKSIDARKKPEVSIVYSVDVWVDKEEKILKHSGNKNAVCVKEKKYNLKFQSRFRLFNQTQHWTESGLFFTLTQYFFLRRLFLLFRLKSLSLTASSFPDSFVCVNKKVSVKKFLLFTAKVMLNTPRFAIRWDSLSICTRRGFLLFP